MPSEPKTKPTDASVEDFLEAVSHPGRREDGKRMAAFLAEITGEKPVMWGESIVGYGSYRGPTGDWPVIGFSPRKGNLVVYIMTGFAEQADLLDRLGPHKIGKSCLYVNRLSEIELPILRRLAEQSIDWVRDRYPTR